jgi:1-piperideine-2-carboxylate/1-pyrroline-2-carboxylate reductase [NAD(P)H]
VSDRSVGSSGKFSRIPTSTLLREINRAAHDVASGRIKLPARMIESTSAGVDLFAMLAIGADLGVVKLMSIGPRATADRLAKLIAIRPDGALLGEFAATAATAERTAAVSFACALRLEPQLIAPVLIVGAGQHARAHVEFLAAHVPGIELLIAARTPESGVALCEHARQLGADAKLAPSLTDATSAARLIVTATTSSEPVLPDVVRRDAIVIAMGNYRADSSELPASLIARSRLHVDCMAGAHHEAGELLRANVDWSQVQALDQHEHWVRDRTRPAVVKSVGSAAWDLAWVRARLATA